MDPAAKSLQTTLRSAIYELKDKNRRRYERGYDTDGRAMKEEYDDAASLLGETDPAEGESAAAYGARLHAMLCARRERILKADPDDWASVALNGILHALEEELGARGIPYGPRR